MATSVERFLYDLSERAHGVLNVSGVHVAAFGPPEGWRPVGRWLARDVMLYARPWVWPLARVVWWWWMEGARWCLERQLVYMNILYVGEGGRFDMGRWVWPKEGRRLNLGHWIEMRESVLNAHWKKGYIAGVKEGTERVKEGVIAMLREELEQERD